MSSIVHIKILHCFDYTTDDKVRMMIGNLACGLHGADLFVMGDNLWSADGSISISASSPADITRFISAAVYRHDGSDCIEPMKTVRRKTVTGAVRSYVVGLGLPSTESRNVINTLNMIVLFNKIKLDDVVFDKFSNVVGIKGVTVDGRGTVTLATHPYKYNDK